MTTPPRRTPAPRDDRGYPVRLAKVRAVWAYLSAHPRTTAAELRQALGIRSQGDVQAAIRILEGAGYIARPRAGRRVVHRAWRILVPLGEVRP